MSSTFLLIKYPLLKAEGNAIMFRVIYMYVCPICKKRLRKLDNVWHCQNGHSFDIARKGYVNLLTTKGRNPKNAGDNAEMVKARTDFLDRDYYLPLAKKTAG